MVIRTGTSSGRATPEARRFDADAEPKLGRCFPIFSRCDYKTRMMVIAEVNDENALSVDFHVKLTRGFHLKLNHRFMRAV